MARAILVYSLIYLALSLIIPRMPQELARLWTDQDLVSLESTIINLRKIRGAATFGLEPPKTGIRAALAMLGRRVPIPEDRQKVLHDGENLAEAAALFMTTRIVKNQRDQSAMDKWEHFLQETTDQYRRYPVTTFARTTRTEVAISTVGHLRAISIDPGYVLDWDLFRGNRVGANNVTELLRNRTTLVAPLAGDLLLAAIYRAQLKLARGQTFPLKTVAMSKDLKHFVLPDLSAEAEERRDVGVFLDIVESGNTSKVLYQALRSSYPDLRVYEPQMQRVEFQPSSKIRRITGG